MKSAQTKPKRIPQRTCVACRTTGGKRGLLRIVRLPEDAGVAIDHSGKRNGRGAYICPTLECIAIALKRKSFERSLKIAIPDEVAELLLAAVQDRDAGEKVDQVEKIKIGDTTE